MGAYSLLENRFGQLPGAGEVITNVSIGDLTDQAHGRRRRRLRAIERTDDDRPERPALPGPAVHAADPDVHADPSGTLDPVGSTEGEDPSLGEVMLDFGVMAPLPHNLQRPSDAGQRPHRPARHRPRRAVPPGGAAAADLRPDRGRVARRRPAEPAPQRDHREPRLRHRRVRLPRPLPRGRPGPPNGDRIDRAAVPHRRDHLRQRRHPAVHPDRGRPRRGQHRHQHHPRPGCDDQHQRRPDLDHAEPGARQRRDRGRRHHPGRHHRRSHRRPVDRCRTTRRSRPPAPTGPGTSPPGSAAGSTSPHPATESPCTSIRSAGRRSRSYRC